MNLKKVIAICVILLVVASGGFWLKQLHYQATHKARRSPCQSNLSIIGKSMALYSMDHDEEYPETFADLASGYLDNAYIFHCPTDTDEPGEIANVDEWSSYVLIPRNSNAVPEDVHAFCSPANHKNKGANVLFVDGSISWLNLDEFENLLTEQGIATQ